MKAWILIAFLLAYWSTTACRGTPLTWRRLSDSAPNGFGSAFAYDSQSNSLVLFGRFAAAENSSTWIYDVAGDFWSALDESPSDPLTRRYAYYGIVQVNGTSLFVVTHGIGADEYSDVWVFNIGTQIWYQPVVTGSGPGARYGGHFGAIGDTLWVGAGFTLTTSIPSRYIDTYRLIFSLPNQASWEMVHSQPTSGNQFNPLVPHGRCLHSSSVVDVNTIVMWGGCMR